MRTRVAEVSIIGRNTGGVRLIRTMEGEEVVSLERIAEPAGDENDEPLAADGVETGLDAVDTDIEGDEPAAELGIDE